MKPGTTNRPVDFVGQRSNNEVTKSKRRSRLRIAITPLILKLERRSKVQNVGNCTGFLVIELNFRLDFRLQS